MNQGWCYEDHIQPQDAGKTVLEFYSKFSHSTPEEWQARIQQGQIRLDGQAITPNTRLQAHSILSYHRPPWTEPQVPLDLPILYEDDEIWVIDKPSGLPVLPGGRFLEHTVLGQLRLRYPQEQMAPVHRLGRGTSGLLLLARSPQARASLSQQMRDRQILKIYRALVGPDVVPNQFTITQPIGKLPYPQLGYLYCADPAGKPAESHCTVLKRTSESTIIKVQITTGRPHQIRIHLAYYGHPLLGDPLYTSGGKPKPAPIEATAIPSDGGYTLHASQLEFTHPTNRQIIHLTAPIPTCLRE